MRIAVNRTLLLATALLLRVLLVYGIDWWAQAVTIRYEWEHGLRGKKSAR